MVNPAGCVYSGTGFMDRRGHRVRDVHVTELGTGLILVRVEDRTSGEEVPAARLSKSERAVVELAQRGLSNRDIAARRRCSVRTVANHLASAYGKLGVSGRRELRARLKQESRSP